MRVAHSVGFDENDCQNICMAVREAVINAFRYGNQEQREKKIHMTVEVEGDRFVIHVLDQGHGFDLSSVPDPLAEENLLKTSGRGILLMRTFMDEFEVRRSSSGGTWLVMAKLLPHSPKRSNHTA
jgi:serine/threonine-protein kinase RsbW